MTERADAPGPLRRRGPRPLLLHLTLAMLRSNASLAASVNSKPGWANSNEAAAAILQALAAGGGEAEFPAAVLAETLRQDAALITGLASYRRHPYSRTLTEPSAIWTEGGSRLLDYGGDGPVVLFVPSLVNRAYVLDLAPGHSVLRWLAEHGARPLLLDWGWPGEVERRFTLTDYVAGRLERALVVARDLTGAPVVLAGYCMGGMLAVAATARRPELVRALALLATPWDFHAAGAEQALAAAQTLPLLEPLLTFNDTLPVDALQVLFAMLDPWGVAEKFRAFARLSPDSERAALFVALEDWVNDGVPLAAAVARESLGGWYGENTPARGEWRIAGLPVDPSRIRRHTLVAAPARDRIVPAESAEPLAQVIEGATLHRPNAGHVGMIAGAAAERVLWVPMLDWLQGL